MDADLRNLERNGDERALMLARVRSGLCPGCGGPSVEWPGGSRARVCPATCRRTDPSLGETLPAFWREGDKVYVTWPPVSQWEAAKTLEGRIRLSVRPVAGF